MPTIAKFGIRQKLAIYCNILDMAVAVSAFNSLIEAAQANPNGDEEKCWLAQ